MCCGQVQGVSAGTLAGPLVPHAQLWPGHMQPSPAGAAAPCQPGASFEILWPHHERLVQPRSWPPCSYDLKQLFIGSEGSLGLITAVAIHCPPRPLSGGFAADLVAVVWWPLVLGAVHQRPHALVASWQPAAAAFGSQAAAVLLCTARAWHAVHARLRAALSPTAPGLECGPAANVCYLAVPSFEAAQQVRSLNCYMPYRARCNAVVSGVRFPTQMNLSGFLAACPPSMPTLANTDPRATGVCAGKARPWRGAVRL